MCSFRNMFIIIVFMFGMSVLTGCAYLQGHKDDINAMIIKVIETDGQVAANLFIDKLVEDGRLTKDSADRIKKIIPQGVDVLKEAMNYEKK